ncbi:DUF715-domain-containing protein [Suhomyces tanzawaensis NRRL Y-17324]|uniref:tRNA:m(4)X modification enzyme TRM13 n=1 Tax=Suhomyces tanzawaensis NRRL Y-17324 TaxID=984487 RepID=A0A1E4SFF5_9ASCO|nr:DUF715-domain-containing protein [Suhomyces tanzawaensis NRRL Y-17324]ODV78190.1 DUF715-domain-containing protein [Suhomyces tanzawaensis NRRL Y-17324]
MQRKADHRFCSEHMINESTGERIPCPLDNKHTVWAKDLAIHLKKCNAKQKVEFDIWYEKDLNSGWKHLENLAPANLEPSTEEAENDSFEKHLELLKKIKFDPLPMKILEHSGLNPRISELKNPKHALQQSSLIGNMKQKGLLDSNTFYLEFGCGKAELSRFVNLCILEDLKTLKIAQHGIYGYGLIDRGINRMKMDPKIIKDSRDVDLEPKVKRTRIDIKDLNLDKFLQDTNADKVVGISKHLCGVATDLTLKLLLNSTLLESGKFGGVVIAMCCRHVCDYHELLPQSRQYLKMHGFDSMEGFKALKKVVSWAVCGVGRAEKKDENGEIERDESLESTGSDSMEHGLTYHERETLGLTARRLVDESRVHAIKELMKDYDVEIFNYTERKITLENVCLSIRPRV